jgi:uncharacterized protein (TIGR03118 family)
MKRFSRQIILYTFLALLPAVVSNTATAQYVVGKLTADQAGVTPNRDAHLINAWGLARGANSAWWINNERSGFATLHDASGVLQTLQQFDGVVIPSALASRPGSPTGIVNSKNGGFPLTLEAATPSAPAVFMFATLDGQILGWNPNVALGHAVVAVNNVKTGASYRGLAITDNPGKRNFIFAADAANNRIDIYDDAFVLVGSFTDSHLPVGFVPNGIRDIEHELYVTFAALDDDIHGGIVDVFHENGEFVRRLVDNNGVLDHPWGLALSPANFGPFSNSLLVSNNNGPGTIAAIDPDTGAFRGFLKDPKGKVIAIDEIWGIDFGGGTAINGLTNTLFFTAGPNEYQDGLFGRIQFIASTVRGAASVTGSK